MDRPQAPVVEPASGRAEHGNWRVPLRIAFRFAFAYFAISTIYLAFGYVPFAGVLTQPITGGLFNAYTWVRNALFPSAPYGTIAGFWAYMLTALLLAGLATLIWSLADRRTEYQRLHRWLRIYLRFFLAVVMLGYGAHKLIPTQFPRPPLTVLITPLGEMERMRLLWSFMGSSSAYAAIGGAGEVLGALLLLAPSTTTVGALILLPVLTNVVALNFAYEVNVKLTSTVYLLIALFLLTPEMPRLLRMLRAQRADQLHHWRPPWRLWAALAKWSIVAVLIATAFSQAYRDYFVGSDGAPLPALYGIYDVDRMDVRTPTGSVTSLNDTLQWRRLAIAERGGGAIQPIRGAVRRYRVRSDTIRRTLLLERQDVPAAALSFQYSQSRGVLTLDGIVAGDSVTISLRAVNLTEFVLRRPAR